MAAEDAPAIPNRSWLRSQLAAAWEAWEAYRASFLFVEELQGWPAVRRLKPDVLVMHAPHTGPRRVQSWGGLKPGVITGIVFVVLVLALQPAAAPGVELVRDRLFPGMIFGAVIGAISIPLWRLAMMRTRFAIRFERGAISWQGPDRLKHMIPAHEVPASRLQVLVPHRWAQEEIRKHGEVMRRRRGQSGPAPKPLFQTASELVMQTGPGGSHWRTVAEFRNDGSGEHAHRLLSAIDFVTERALAEQAERKRVEIVLRAAVMSNTTGWIIFLLLVALTIWRYARRPKNQPGVHIPLLLVRAVPKQPQTVCAIIAVAFVAGMGWFLWDMLGPG